MCAYCRTRTCRTWLRRSAGPRRPSVGDERELFAQIPRRRTHRGGFDSEPLPDGMLTALIAEASKEGARLQVLGDKAQRDALAAVVEAGDYALRHDPARAREQAHWAPAPGSKRRDGVPATAYQSRPAGSCRTSPPGTSLAVMDGDCRRAAKASFPSPPASSPCSRPAQTGRGLDQRRAGPPAHAAIRHQLRSRSRPAQPAT